MYSPVFLDDNNSGEGIFKQIDFTFSQKVFVCTPEGVHNRSFTNVDFGDSFLIVDHSDDPITQFSFELLHYPNLNINPEKIIVVSPSPDQLFYQEPGSPDYITVNRKYKSPVKFKHIFCNGMFVKVKNLFDPNLVAEKQISKLFISLSRKDKIERRLLNYLIHKNNLFDLGIVSHQRTLLDYSFNIKEDLKAFIKREDFDANLYMKYGLRKHYVDNVFNYDGGIDYGTNIYELVGYSKLIKNCLIELCVETNALDFLFITEKLLKPIVFKTPFLLMGCPYTLKYIRQLGFETFGCVFDESYDEQPILYDRVQGVVTNLKQISTLSLQDAIKKFKITEEICNHNYDVFMNSDWSFDLQQKIERAINVR